MGLCMRTGGRALPARASARLQMSSADVSYMPLNCGEFRNRRLPLRNDHPASWKNFQVLLDHVARKSSPSSLFLIVVEVVGIEATVKGTA